MRPIENPDVSNTDQKYWETVLESHGLGVRRAETKKSGLRGGIAELVKVEEIELRKESGQVKPKGFGPDR